MTEDYWRKYKKEFDNSTFQRNKLWKNVIDDLKASSPGKHYLELHNICLSENPYIR